MLELKTCAAVADALHDTDLDLSLRGLIRLRARQLHAGQKSHPWFFVIQGGDTADVINRALGFSITGDDAEPASCDWIQDHGLWFEIAYGHTRIFVENGPGTELGLHYLCLAHFWSSDVGQEA